MMSSSYQARAPVQDPTAGKIASVVAAAGAGAEGDVERTVGLLNWVENDGISAAAAAGDVVGVDDLGLEDEAFEVESC